MVLSAVGAWTLNTNTTKEGFVPYRVMFGYDPSFPGFETSGDNERDVKTMEKHLYDQLEVRKAFLENEYKRRIKICDGSESGPEEGGGLDGISGSF